MTATLEVAQAAAKPSLENYLLVDTTKIAQWKKATKTKPIKAKHIQSLLIDDALTTKLLLQTLEGSQMLKATSMVCLGAIEEPWQQTPEKLLKQYTVTEITPQGWLVCTPKPENERDLFETESLANSAYEGYAIYAQWGERQSDGRFIQFGKFGDPILRNQDDLSDVWIVARNLFDSTYDLK